MVHGQWFCKGFTAKINKAPGKHDSKKHIHTIKLSSGGAIKATHKQVVGFLKLNKCDKLR